MSKNISIQEGGIGKKLTVDKLKTGLVGGGSCLWVPEDGTTLGTKYINADGTYKASNDGLYGYSEVTVRGTGKATGKDSDGDEAYAYTDPTTGRLMTDKLPSSLVVDANPSKMTYWDGETLDFTGMVVKAYLATGGLWTDSSHPNGVIPVSELVFPVTEADYSKVRSDEYSDGNGVNAEFMSYVPVWDIDWAGRDVLLYLSGSFGTFDMKWGGETYTEDAYWGGGSESGPTSFYATQYNDAETNKTILYIWGSTENRALNVFVDNTFSEEDPHSNYRQALATTASTGSGGLMSFEMDSRYHLSISRSTSIPKGTEELHPVDAYQEIPVQWTRPNGDVLETSFRITVVPSN